MKRRHISIIILALIFSGCQHDESEPLFESVILGNWLVVSENYDAAVTEWGFFYVASVKLYPDKTFKVNLGDQTDDPNALKHGTWELVNNHTIINTNAIKFYTYINDQGTIYRDTTEFSIRLVKADKMILENERIKILHKKLNN